MKFRQLRKIDTGQWLDVLFTVDGPEFSVPPASHQRDIAAALGLAPAALEVLDADSDVRVGPRLPLPVAPSIVTRREALRDKGRLGQLTPAEIQEAVTLALGGSP